MRLNKVIWFAGSLLFCIAIAPGVASAQPKLAGCRGSQLRLTQPDWEDCCGLGHFAKVIQVRNSTAEACELTGAPHLRLLDSSGHQINIPVCPNCTDYTFQVKPYEPVVLKRGGSAFFLLGYTTLDSPNGHCGKVARVGIAFPDDKAVRVEFNMESEKYAPACDFNVSAWRAGPFRPEAIQ